MPKFSKIRVSMAVLGLVILVTFLVISQGSDNAEGCEKKLTQANERATAGKYELNSLTIINNQPTKAESNVSGDCLTGYSDYVKASFSTNETLKKLEDQVQSNLSKEGYVIDGRVREPYYAARDKSIVFRYEKDSHFIYGIYHLDKKISCPDKKICRRDDETKSRTDINDVGSYGNLNIIKAEFFYSQLKTASFLW